jgi:hypothetical protein
MCIHITCSFFSCLFTYFFVLTTLFFMNDPLRRHPHYQKKSIDWNEIPTKIIEWAAATFLLLLVVCFITVVILAFTGSASVEVTNNHCNCSRSWHEATSK